MSIIDKLLVLFDDQKQRTIEDVKNIFPKYSNQIISASLGRIVSRGWINKKSNYYQITESGRKLITNKLDGIERIENDNTFKKCLFVIFHIPEKERINRDIMRNFLLNNGYGRLHNTVWIKFNSKISILNSFIKDLKINDKVLTFEATPNQEKIKEIIDFTKWNTIKIDKKYSDFITEAKYFLNTNDKNNILARCIVYQFAKIIYEDPFLPPKNKKICLRDQAYKYYLKIRKFC